MNVSDERIKYSNQLGSTGESIFCEMCATKGWTVLSASRMENIFDHFDYYIYPKGLEVRVDVKAKKTVTSDNRPAVCLEFMNVSGRKGWLFGKADCIAILSPDRSRFLVVPRRILLAYALQFKDEQITEDKKLYKLYRRTKWDRLDLVTFVKWEDLLSLDGIWFWENEISS